MSYSNPIPVMPHEKRIPKLIEAIHKLKDTFKFKDVWKATHNNIYYAEGGLCASSYMKEDLKELVRGGYLIKSGITNGSKYHKVYDKFGPSTNQLSFSFKQ